MTRFVLLIWGLFFVCYWSENQLFCLECSDREILENKIPLDDRRYPTFLEALHLLKDRQALTIVETGTARYGLAHCLGDGCSTIIFGEWVKNHGGEFYSVDISAENLEHAAEALDTARAFVNLIHSDSIDFLMHFNRPIDFLYLDSYDFDFENPTPSQEHHLKEIIAAYPWLTKNSVVMIDDCDLPYGGKGKLVIDFLLANDWKILKSGYQVILVRL